MDRSKPINTLYQPVQPCIGQSDSKVCYREVKPIPSLEGTVHCYWQLKTNNPLSESFVYRVVADGCIDLFFDVSDTNESFVMGFSKKFTEFPLHDTFHYIGIRFYPTMFPQLFRINAKELSNQVFELSSVIPEMANFIRNRVAGFMELSQIASLLDTYLAQLALNTVFDSDNRLYGAVCLILKNQGNLRTEKDLNTGISPRQLRRLFDQYIGTSPKSFSKVVQFQNVLKAKPSIQSLKQNKIFYDLGYSDQAHFIRDFRNFYGLTPSTALR